MQLDSLSVDVIFTRVAPVAVGIILTWVESSIGVVKFPTIPILRVNEVIFT